MKVVLQDGIKDCGICCLLSVIRYYGGDISKEYLREITCTTKNGVSAAKIVEAAEKIGFEADGVRGNLEKIEKDDLPCIAHIIVNKSYKHFVVIYEVNSSKKRVTIMDPARGKVVLSFSEFNLLTSFYYIFLKPKKKIPKLLSRKVIRKSIWEFLKKEKAFIISISLLTIFSFLFQIVSAFHFKYLLEYSVKYEVVTPIFIVSVFLLCVYLFRGITDLVKSYLLAKVVCLLDSKIMSKVFRQILLLPYIYYKNRTTGEVISRLRDLNVIKSFLARVYSFIITDFIGTIVFGSLLFCIHKKLSFLICVILSVFFVFQIFYVRKKRKVEEKIKLSEDKTNSYLVDSLSNVDTVKNNHLEKRIYDKFMIQYHKLLENYYQLISLESCDHFLETFVHDSLLTIILGFGSFFVVTNKIAIGELIVFQTVFHYFLNSFENLLVLYSDYSSFKISVERINELFTISDEKFNGSYYYVLSKLNGDIIFSNLTYSCNHKELFHNLNLTMKSGEKIFFVGPSGNGKSTLMKMLLRYIEVPFGSIQIGNMDINHYHLEVLRQEITYVGSFEFLFSDTLYNNIAFHRDIAIEEFNKVIKIAKVDEIVKDNNLGYKMLVEENGFNFSNGEKQRIILARALLRKSSIYIFDEAFSQIDIRREGKIINDILDYLKEKTVIVISHRYTQQKLFDRVLKLQNGGIHEIKKL